MKRARGASLVEVLVALVLGLFLVQVGMSTVAGARTSHQRVADRTEVLAAVRFVDVLLRAETGIGRPAVDWSVRDDELPVRAFRGTGLACPTAGDADVVVVEYRGYRRPDPAKDSVLLVYPDGDDVAVGLRAAAPGPPACEDHAMRDPVELRLDHAVPAGAVLARVFERGDYVLADGALRYRRGAAGRQPLTPEIWSGDIGWRIVDGRVEATLGAAGGDRWRVPVALGPR